MGKDYGLLDWFWIDKQRNDENFRKIIFFSDEEHFHFDSYVNNQNCRNRRGTENRQMSTERQTHPLRTTVRCVFRAKGVIGPIFFRSCHHCERPSLQKLALRVVLAYVGKVWMLNSFRFRFVTPPAKHWQERFAERVVSLHGNQEWPARSREFTPRGFFLCGLLKSSVCVNKPWTIPEL